MPDWKFACRKKIYFRLVILSSETNTFLQENGIWRWHRLVPFFCGVTNWAQIVHIFVAQVETKKEAASEITFLYRNLGLGGLGFSVAFLSTFSCVCVCVFLPLFAVELFRCGCCLLCCCFGSSLVLICCC